MGTHAKAIRLVVGAYVVTVGAAACIVLLALVQLADTHSCSAMSRALLVLWGTLAVVFLASTVVVGVAARKAVPAVAGRRTAVAGYAVALLASYIVIAFGLLLAFNC